MLHFLACHAKMQHCCFSAFPNDTSTNYFSQVDGLRIFSPSSKIGRASFGKVPLAHIAHVMNTGKFNFDDAANALGWLQELRG